MSVVSTQNITAEFFALNLAIMMIFTQANATKKPRFTRIGAGFEYGSDAVGRHLRCKPS